MSRSFGRVREQGVITLILPVGTYVSELRRELEDIITADQDRHDIFIDVSRVPECRDLIEAMATVPRQRELHRRFVVYGIHQTLEEAFRVAGLMVCRDRDAAFAILRHGG